jgi:cytochrome c biogenesis protein CcmG/thiol:disulfide interchange protein DsbE
MMRSNARAKRRTRLQVTNDDGAADVPESGRRLRRAAAKLLRTAAVGSVVALLGLLIWDMFGTSSGAKFTTLIKRGKKPAAPVFSLSVLWDRRETWPVPMRSRLDDNKLVLTELRGFPVVVNFWASWCLPCRDEAPAFRSVAQRYRGRVAFVGMDTQDLKSAARRFLRRYEVNYVSVRDGSAHTYTAYGLTGVPETYFLDRRGRAVAHSLGAVSAQELERNVRLILKNP